MPDAAAELRIVAFDEFGNVVADNIIEDVTGEGPGFYAHQTLHRDGAVCVEIFEPSSQGVVRGWASVLQRCDPGVDFATVAEGGPRP